MDLLLQHLHPLFLCNLMGLFCNLLPCQIAKVSYFSQFHLMKNVIYFLSETLKENGTSKKASNLG